MYVMLNRRCPVFFLYSGGLPCEYEGIIPSPVVEGYRNKCEFSIGLDREGNRVVGFQLGSYREGLLAIAKPTGCRNISPAALAFAALLQEVVGASSLPVWDKKDNKGFWRLLTVSPRALRCLK